MPLPHKNRDLYVKDWRKAPKAIEKFGFVHHFLPHPEKKERASLISNKAILFYCFLVVIISALFRFLPRYFPGVLGYASNITVRDLLYYTNYKRSENDLKPLRLNTKLMEAADDKAHHMISKNYWAHISPDGIEPWSFFLSRDYDYSYAGENLAKNFSTSKDVVEAWYNSPSHRDNLLSPNYDEIGFATINGVLDGYQTTLVVQMFGRPRDLSLLATAEEEEKILTGLEGERVMAVKDTVPAPQEVKNTPVITQPKVNVSGFAKSFSLVLGGFVTALYVADIVYSRKYRVTKMTGHTLAHFVFLAVIIVSIWLVIKPGVIM